MNKLKSKEFFYHTSKGTLYNLTKENQQGMNINYICFQIADIYRLKEVFERFPQTMNFKKYFSYQDKQVVLTSIDYYTKMNRGCQDENSIEINDYGFKKLTNENYLKFAQLIQPDILISLTEEGRESSYQKQKSSKRNIKKSMKFLKQTIEFKKKNNQKWKIYAVLQGNNFEELRKQNLQELEQFKNEIDGIICYGVFQEKHRNEKLNIKEDIYSFEQRLKVYNSLQDFNMQQSLLLSSDGDYLKILEGLHFNFTQFETQFPFILAQHGKACLFNVKQWDLYAKHYVSNNYEFIHESVRELFNKNSKVKSINLNDENFAKDLSPIDIQCNCLTCKSYSRAYISHLLKHQEMTANVLLTIHNTYQHRLFLELINTEEFNKNQNRYITAFWFLFTEVNDLI